MIAAIPGMAAIVAAPFSAACGSTMGYPAATNDDRANDRIGEAVSAFPYPGISRRHPIEGARTWKSFDRAAMDRLHDKGLISDPAGKANSAIRTDTGPLRAEAAFRRSFEADDGAAPA